MDIVKRTFSHIGIFHYGCSFASRYDCLDITAIAVTAFLVVFQPELRKALEQLGSQNLLSGILAQDDGKISQEFNDRTVNELVRATFEMAKVKTGALMVIERGTSLKEIERY